MLRIAAATPAEAVLQWPTNHSGFRVESALNLGPGSLWQTFTNAVTVNGELFNVSLGTTNAAQFFRLRK